MPLIEKEEAKLAIYPKREITVTPTTENTVVLVVEDPHSIAVVEMSQDQLRNLRVVLNSLQK